MNQMKIDDEVFNKVSLLGENKINRLNQILTKLHSPLKTPQTDLSGNPLNPFPSTGMPGMPIPLTSIQGIQTLLNQVNSVQKEIKKDAEGPLLAPPKPELPDMPFFTGAEDKTEIPTFDEPKRTQKKIQKSAEIHKKLIKTKPIGIQLKPINKSPTVGPIGIAPGLSNAQPPQNHSKTKTQPTNKIVAKTEKKVQMLAGKNLDLIGLKFKFFKCTQCDETFTSKELRDKHEHNNHFDCKGCDLSFSSQVSYEVHTRFGHGPYKCEICPAMFDMFSLREKHRSDVHGGIQIFMCRDCGARFTTFEATICHQVLYRRCSRSSKIRKPKTKRDAADQSKLLKIVNRSRIIYKSPSNETIIVV
jgi:transcription elongation factor Elf1